jgi:hypothetical protein
MLNTVPRAYTVTLRIWADKNDPKYFDQDIPVQAYDLIEAGVTANMQYMQESGYDQARGKIEIRRVLPTLAKESREDLMTRMLQAGQSIVDVKK